MLSKSTVHFLKKLLGFYLLLMGLALIIEAVTSY